MTALPHVQHVPCKHMRCSESVLLYCMSHSTSIGTGEIGYGKVTARWNRPCNAMRVCGQRDHAANESPPKSITSLLQYRAHTVNIFRWWKQTYTTRRCSSRGWYQCRPGVRITNTTKFGNSIILNVRASARQSLVSRDR